MQHRLRRSLLLVAVFAFGGCDLLSPCVPVEMTRVVYDAGVLGPDPLRFYPDGGCVLVSSEVYDAWAAFGLGAQLETWYCGCEDTT